MGSRQQVESAAEKKDSCGVVQEVAKASWIGLDALDFGVESHSHRVGDAKGRKVQQSIEVPGQYLGDLFHFRKKRFSVVRHISCRRPALLHK